MVYRVPIPVTKIQDFIIIKAQGPKTLALDTYQAMAIQLAGDKSTLLRVISPGYFSANSLT